MFCRQRLYKRDRGSISLSHCEIGNGLHRLMLFGPVIHVSLSPASLQHRGMAQAGNSSAACRCEKMNLNEWPRNSWVCLPSWESSFPNNPGYLNEKVWDLHSRGFDHLNPSWRARDFHKNPSNKSWILRETQPRHFLRGQRDHENLRVLQMPMPLSSGPPRLRPQRRNPWSWPWTEGNCQEQRHPDFAA